MAERIPIRTLAAAAVLALAAGLLAAPPAGGFETVKVGDKMREIYDVVFGEGSMALLRHLHGRADREEVVVMFVAALELLRLGAVRVEQTRPFAEIYLRPGANLLREDDFAGQEETRGS